MIPSGQPKLIAESASVYCQNTFSRFGDLRPVKTDAEVASGAVANAKTQYRMSRKPDGSSFADGTTGWKTSAGLVNYVRGPVAGDSTERTYYTGDGAPKATNLAGVIRALGVPEPTSAPTVTVNAVAQMTPEEVTTSYNDLISTVVQLLKANLTGGSETRITPPDITGGEIDPVDPWNLIWSFADTAENAYLLNATIGGYRDGGAIKVRVSCRPAVAVLNESALRAGLAALKKPDDDGPGDHVETDLFSSEQIDNIVDSIKKTYTAEGTFVKTRLAEMKSEFDSVVKIISSGQAATASVSAMRAFYALPAVTLEVSKKRTDALRQLGLMGGTRSNVEGDSSIVPADTTLIAPTLDGLVMEQADGSNAMSLSSAKSAALSWLSGVGVQPAAFVDIGYGMVGTASQLVENALSAWAASLAVSNWRSHPSFPSTQTSVEGAGITTQLRAHFDRLHALVKEIESNEVNAITPSKVQAMVSGDFATYVAPDYPTGVVPIETTYTYVFTWVTDWDEESAPSPASELVTCDQNDTRTVTRTGTPPANVVKWRLYRSNTGTVSSLFQLQGEYPIATSSIEDSKEAEYLDEACPSFGWLVPPEKLQGLTGMPNGIMVGFVDRTLYFCEPYKPYAWPADYDKPLPVPIVGLGAFGQTLFVGTEGKPYLVSGVDSASMSEQLLEFEQSCVSARSITTFGSGVAYASPDGLCLIGNGIAPSVVTKGIMSAEAWRAYNPKEMFGAFHDNRIYMFAPTKALVWDLEMGQLFELDVQATAAVVDLPTDTLYYVSGTSVHALFGGATNRTAKWWSKTWHAPKPISLAWLYVDGDITAPVTVKVYADGVLKQTHTFSTTYPKRLPPGLHSDWRFEVETAADQVVFLSAASSTKELQGVN